MKKKLILISIMTLMLLGIFSLYQAKQWNVPKENRYSHPNGPKNIKREDVALTYGEHYCVRGTNKEEAEKKYLYTVRSGLDDSNLSYNLKNYKNTEWWYDKNFSHIKKANEQFKTEYDEQLYDIEFHKKDSNPYLIYHEDCSMSYRLELAHVYGKILDKDEELEHWLTVIDIAEAFNKEQEGYIKYIYLTYERYHTMDITIKINMNDFEDANETERKEMLDKELQSVYSL